MNPLMADEAGSDAGHRGHPTAHEAVTKVLNATVETAKQRNWLSDAHTSADGTLTED